MNNEQDADRTSSRRLKRRWDEEDAARDELETKAKELFLEERANAIFAPIEECLTRLDNVLRRFNASLEIDPTWEHFDEERLRRRVKVKSTQSDRQLSLDFNIHGVKIFHRDKCYQFAREIETLIRVLIDEVVHFLKREPDVKM